MPEQMDDKAKIPTLIDNYENNTLLNTLRQLLSLTAALNIATGTSRETRASADDLTAWRKEMEQKCVKAHLRDVNAPMGEKAILVCWMEVC